ncbi:MAG: hypothetical protein LBJ41_03270 [Treponema sp.]|nr:hypothetical protein [Treponema sp.]
MKKALLYKPQNDDIDVSVVAYANEAFIDWGCSKSKNTSGCGNRCTKNPWPEGFDFFCKKPKTNDNQVCPRE